MNTSLLTEGIAIMGIGMGVVFSFLVLTIFAMIIMSKVVGYLNKIFPEATAQIANTNNKKTSDNDAQIALAIVAAMAKK